MTHASEMTDASEDRLLEIGELRVEYPLGRHRTFRAVDGVSFTLAERETLGLVGESGSGKSTIARAVLGLVPSAGGTIRFSGKDITAAARQERRRLSRSLQVVFQDPFSSLNPSRTVGQTLAETLHPHLSLAKGEAASRVTSMLERVGLPKDAADRYPIEFSGGQRQRVAIARALMMSPRLVICDEAVSALDLSVQAQVLNLLIDLQSSLGLSYLFISHDLAVVRHVSHRLLVLYRGQAMEYGSASAIYDRPLHPYTQTLLAAAPAPDPSRRRGRRSPASARSTQTLQPSGVTSSSCPFAARCAHSTDLCRERRPELTAAGDDHFVACHHWQKLTIDGPHPSRPAFPVRHQVR